MEKTMRQLDAWLLMSTVIMLGMPAQLYFWPTHDLRTMLTTGGLLVVAVGITESMPRHGRQR